MKSRLFILMSLAVGPFCLFGQSCLPEGIIFHQNEIDSFRYLYPGCTRIEGKVSLHLVQNVYGLTMLTSIGGKLEVVHAMFSDFKGLENLRTIDGNLEIFDNSKLISLTGLNGLSKVGGNLSIGLNDGLTSMTGLESLDSIGESLYIFHNDALYSLTGMQNITIVNGQLFIDHNPYLQSLTSLDRLDGGLLDSLVITENSSLTECDIQSVCNYLGLPGSKATIEDNAPGCQSREEVLAGCSAGTPDGTGIDKATLRLYPNPATTDVNCEVRIRQRQKVRLAVFDLFGKEVEKLFDNVLSAGEHRFTWRPKDLPPGIYMIRMQAGDLRLPVNMKVVLMEG